VYIWYEQRLISTNVLKGVCVYRFNTRKLISLSTSKENGNFFFDRMSIERKRSFNIFSSSSPFFQVDLDMSPMLIVWPHRSRKKKKNNLLFAHLSMLKLFYSHCIGVNHPLLLSTEKERQSVHLSVSKQRYIYACAI
jgi:hypothetical protein